MTSMHRRRYFEREAYNKKMLAAQAGEQVEGEQEDTQDGETGTEQPQE